MLLLQLPLKCTHFVNHAGRTSCWYQRTYQVTCGGGEARTVHASVTSILSHTACTRRGIQNIGGRPERSSMQSFSICAFSTACDKDRINKGNGKGLFPITQSLTQGTCTITLQGQEYKALSLLLMVQGFSQHLFRIFSRMLLRVGNYSPVGISATNRDIFSDLPPKGLPVSSHTQQPAVPNNLLFQLFHLISKPNPLLPPLLKLQDGSFSSQLVISARVY